MSAEYMHIGIPITNRKPGMVYNEGAKFWASQVNDYDYKIEYLKFEEGTPFPEVLHRNPHMAYRWMTFRSTWTTRIPSFAAPWTPMTRGISWLLCGRTVPFWNYTKRPEPLPAPLTQQRLRMRDDIIPRQSLRQYNAAGGSVFLLVARCRDAAFQ